MHRVKSLPEYLRARYEHWKQSSFPEQSELFRKLAEEGQHPRAMVVACCDSRVAIGAVFGQQAGELFVHRNIANLVPPYTPDGRHHGTGAALEFAVTALKVEHVLVMGHSRCGGVRGCIDMCQGNAPHLDEPGSLVGRWLDVMRPAYNRAVELAAPEDQQTALEKEAIQLSLENLLGYPFVAEAVDAGRLTLHGLWTDIADMGIETFDGTVRHFVRT